MQAIILAAGMGKRLGDLTKENTKAMIKVNAIPLIDRLLEQLETLNLNRIIVVTGHKGENLRAHIEKRHKHLNIEYVNNPIYDKTNNIYSLWLTKDKFKEDDSLLIESDLIFDIEIFQLLLNTTYPNVALVDKYETWMDGTMVRLDGENNIINFIPKKAFKYEEIESYYKTVNVYKFSKEFIQTNYIPFLEAYIKALGNNEYYEQVLRIITLLDRCNLKAIPLNGQKWYEIDDIQDLDIAETLFAEPELKLSLYQKRYGGYWRFPGFLDFGHPVNPFFPSQQMKEEMKANFGVLLSEYPSGLSINNLLVGKYFGISHEYVCVGNGMTELLKGLMGYLTGNIGAVYPISKEYTTCEKNHEIISFIPQNQDLSYTADDLKAYFAHKDIVALMVMNPDDLSGNLIPKEDILSLIDWAKEKGVLLIVDESLIDFSCDFSTNSLFHNHILESFSNLIVMKSISKPYGVPGLRLGIMATTNRELLDATKKTIPCWNINSFAEFYLQIFNKYETDYKKAHEEFIKEGNCFYRKLQEIRFLRVIPSSISCFLCEVIERYTAKELVYLLLNKYNILIKDYDSQTILNQKNYVRISSRCSEGNARIINALKLLEHSII
jgi:histidinol-phosphate/aromatic aminotransferase/cobyric acid decarboxylase-like protein/choline kinase